MSKVTSSIADVLSIEEAPQFDQDNVLLNTLHVEPSTGVSSPVAGRSPKGLFTSHVLDDQSWQQTVKALTLLASEESRFVAVIHLHETQELPESLSSQVEIQWIDPQFAGNVRDAVRSAWASTRSTILMIAGESGDTLGPDAWLPIWMQADVGEASAVPRSRVASSVARQDRAAIWNKRFTKRVRQWISSYERVGRRDLYLWQWCLHGIEITTMPTVADSDLPSSEAESRTQQLNDLKLLSVILCVLFDDVADQTNDEVWLNELVELVRHPERPLGTSEHQQHLFVTQQLWQTYQNAVRRLAAGAEQLFDEEQHLVGEPQHRLYDVWKFDIEQFLTAMRYSQLINRCPELSNVTEHDIYTPHNMMMISFGTLDMLASPQIPAAEWGVIREALWYIQAMGRVGNVLSTWTRELEERDCSNGLIQRALQAGVVSRRDLEFGNCEELRQTIHRGEFRRELLTQWHRYRRLAAVTGDRVQSFDFPVVLEAHDRFLEMHLGSIGLI